MAKNYMGVNLTGRSLMHYRTKGSRNGYSKNANYKPVGQRATGRLVNGRYVYDTAGSKPANVSQEYWDELQYNTNPNYKPAQKAPKSGINTSIDPRYSVSGTSKINQANVTALAKKGAKNDWQQMAQIASRTGANGMRRENTGASRSSRTLERVGSMSARTKGDKAMAPVAGVYDMNTGKTKSYTYNTDRGYDSRKNAYPSGSTASKTSFSAPSQTAAQKKSLSTHPLDKDHYKTAMGTRIDTSLIVADPKTGNARYGTEIADPRYRVDGSQKIERAKQIAAEKASNKTEAEKKAEQKRIEAGAKARENRQKKREREAKINKMKNAILSVFKKKK